MLVKKFEEQVFEHPNHLAIQTQNEALTYGIINQKANRIANYLLYKCADSEDVKPTLGLLFEHGSDMIAAMIGALKTGLIYTPLDPSYPEQRLAYMVDHSCAKIIVTNSQNLKLAKTISTLTGKDYIIVNIDEISQEYSVENLDIEISDGQIAYILYTSGSTGKPKGVMQTHRNIWHFIDEYRKSLSLTSYDRLTLFSAFSHDAAVMDIYGGLLTGATLYPLNIKNQIALSELTDWLKENKITIWHSVPTVYRFFMSTLKRVEEFPDLRYFVLGGEGIRQHDIQIFQQYFANTEIKLTNLYGQSESSYNSMQYFQADESSKRITLGDPVAETEFLLIDDEGEEVSVFNTGEIVVMSDYIALGYWLDSEKTEEVFIDDEDCGRMYLTGDIGRLLPNGIVEYIGRKDFQVKIRGYRVELGEVENHLLDYPAITECAVIAKEDHEENYYLSAFIVIKEPVSLTDIREYLSQHIPEYMIPTYIVTLDRLPLTPNNKLDRKALLEYDLVLTSEHEYLPPRDDIERQLVGIWEELLGLEKVGLLDNFFEVGGNSLKATSLIGRIYKELQVEIPLRDIFTKPTVEKMAEAIRLAESREYLAIPKVEEREYYSVSSAQKRLYILHQLEPQSTSYNMPHMFVINDLVDIEKVERIFKILIQRHESLRTSFALLEGEVVQRIHPEVEFGVQNLGSVSEEELALSKEAQVELVNRLFVEFVQPFDLSNAPLIRVGFAQLGEKKTVFFYDMHHIISDGTSGMVLQEEFLQLFQGHELSPLRIQYKDYAAWQNALFASEEIQTHEAYWLNRFAGELPVLNLPTDYPRPAVQTFEGAHYNFILNEELTAKLHALANKTGTTIFMTLLAAYNVLLAKYTGQEDIIVGAPIAGRTHVDLERVIGMFVNTLALRNYPIHSQSFNLFLLDVKENVLEAFKYQDYPFEMLVEKLQLERDLSRNPLFDTLLVLQNMKDLRHVNTNIEDEESLLDKGIAKFDLSFTVAEVGTEIRLNCEYSTRLFHRETIERLCSHLRNILQEVTANPELALDQIAMLTADEKDQILCEFNHTDAVYPKDKTIHQLFAEQVAKTPESLAVIFGDQELTYRELDQRSNQLARTLRERMLQTKEYVNDNIIALLVDRSVEMIIAILAILKAGAAYLPVDPDYPEERIEYMLADSKAEILLSSQKLMNKASFSGEKINLFDPAVYHEDDSSLTNISKPKDLLYLIYTSGSTGKPKGAMLEHKNMVNLLSFEYAQTEINFMTKVLQFTTISFDVSYQEIFSTLLAGGQLYLIDNETRKSPEELLSFIGEHSIEVVFLPTSYFKFLTSREEYLQIFPASIRHLIVAGEQLIITNELKQYLSEKRVCLHNHYGPSEAHVVSTYTIEPMKDIPALPPIGKPISNTRLYVGKLDSETRDIKLTPIGVVGELFISGDCVGRGYYERPELTKEKFMTDPFVPTNRIYRTGDLARWLSDGNLEFVGRIDHQVKIRGYRVEIGEIESQILKHNSVKEAVVIVTGEHLCAYLVLSNEITLTELRESLSKELPDYMIPSYFIILDKLPLTPNGKLDRKALPKPESNLEIGVEYVAPGNKIEEILVEIWENILGVQGIGVNHNFFELGGHSLKATLLTAKIHKEMNVELPLREVFKRPTIKAMAELIATMEENLYSAIEAVEEREYYPVSSAQKRVYVQSQFEGASTSYNMPGAIILEGQIEKEQLEQVFTKLIERHETLRTSFVMQDGKVVQKVHPAVDFSINFGECTEEKVQEKFKEFVRPFDLSKAPLLRVGFFKLAEHRHVMFFDMHHIISDGVSMEILVKEFISLYQGIALSALRIQYKDFSVWQNELFKSDVKKQYEEYWLNTFADEVPILNMPTDYPRPSVQSFNGDQVKLELAGELVVQLKTLAAKTGSTMYMLLLSAYNVLLQKYTGQEDIVIGSPIAGRRHADLQNIIGMFVNMLALRNSPCSSKTFMEFYSEVRENTIKAFDHQDYQFEELIEKLNLQRDLSRNPLFDVVFSYQRTKENVGEMRNLRVLPFSMENHIAKFDLTLDVLEGDQELLFSFEFCQDLFARATIERMTNHYVNLLQKIIENPESRLAKIDILSEAERLQLLVEFNHTEMEFADNKTLHELFCKQAEEASEKIALVFDGERLTYEQLNVKTNQLAYQLRSYGIGRNDIVGIMAERSIDMILGILGVLKAGGAYMPIDPDYPVDRIKYMLDDSNARVLLTHNSYFDRIKNDVDWFEYQGKVLDLRSENLYTGNAENLNNINTSEDLAYVMYTSGSTGKPKGVMIEHRGIVSLAQYYQHMFDLDQNKNILHMSNVSFDTSVVEIFPPLMYGATVYIIRKEQALDRHRFIQFVQEHQIHFAQFVPMTLHEILGQSEKPACLNTIIVGGDKLDDTVKDHILSLGYQLTNHYGPTEATIDAIVAKCEKGKSTIGKPIANTRIYILDKDNNLSPIGVPGELCIAGIGLARGYLNRPELTAEKFISNPWVPNEKIYRTGDLASWQRDGNITFLGRIDNQVKIRGYRIELGEIEIELLKHVDITGAVVIDRIDSSGNKFLCAYLVSERELTVSEVREHLTHELPEYMIPSYFIQIERIPLTHNGKVDRHALPEPEGGMAIGTEYVAPSCILEEKLVNIWQEVLGVEDLGVTHNFFEVGGHSLKAMTLLTKIHQEFNVEIPLSIVFKHPTVKELARYIETADQSIFVSIQPVEEREHYPVSSAQKRIYITWQLDEDSTAYNMPTAMILTGELDRARLEKAIHGLVQRHEALRTSFAMVNGEPVQLIHKDIELNVQYLEVDGEELSTITSNLIKPYDLSKAPLFRVTLVRFEAQKYLLYFDMHHIICDGVSSSILIQDFGKIYAGAELLPLKIQYKDFAVWHNVYLESEAVQKISGYWLKELENFTYTELPTSREVEICDIKGRSKYLELGESLTTRINEFCIKHNTTKFSFMLAIFKIILMKTINQNDITIGISVAGRKHTELEHILGVFLNMLVIRTKIQSTERFTEYMLNLRDHLMEAQDYQDYPYEYLYEKAKDSFNFQKNSLFSILFNYLPYQENEGVNLEGITISPYKLEDIESKFGLTLYINEGKDNLFLKAVFNSNLEEATVESILNSFSKVIESVLEEEEIHISQISLVKMDNVDQFTQEFDMDFEELEFI